MSTQVYAAPLVPATSRVGTMNGTVQPRFLLRRCTWSRYASEAPMWTVVGLRVAASAPRNLSAQENFRFRKVLGTVGR